MSPCRSPHHSYGYHSCPVRQWHYRSSICLDSNRSCHATKSQQLKVVGLCLSRHHGPALNTLQLLTSCSGYFSHNSEATATQFIKAADEVYGFALVQVQPAAQGPLQDSGVVCKPIANLNESFDVCRGFGLHGAASAPVAPGTILSEQSGATTSEPCECH